MLTLFSILIPLAVGAGAYAYTRRHPFTRRAYNEDVPCEVSRTELIITGAIIVLISLLVTVLWGPSVARGRTASGYREFWNGSVISASTQDWECTRDGPCVHEYDCDPYIHMHHHPAVTDAKGNVVTPAYDEPHTHYHSCPYATREWSYHLHDNLGRTITISDHGFDAEPRQWRGGSGIPGGVQRGIPERWQASVDRLKASDAEPVTKINTYTNYILPTEGELYKQFSSSIDGYLAKKLLPKHTANLDGEVLFDHEMQAQKFQVVGKVPDVNRRQWNDHLMRFNAALGIERQGDLHIIVLPAARVQNPDDYVNALVAYWQRALGRWGFPKNGIALVLGASADGKTIEWARAKTGMPEGNGELVAAVSFQLPDKALDPGLILGVVRAHSTGKEARYRHGNGVLADILFSDHPFRRACMNCDDKDDNGTGYVYLKDTLPISGGAKLVMFGIVLLISLALWAAALMFDPVGFCTGRSTKRRSSTY